MTRIRRRPYRVGVAAGAALLGALFSSAFVLAQPDDAVRLDYVAPSPCPTAGAFRTELAARRVRVRVVTTEAPRTLLVNIEARAGRFVGRLVLRELAGSETERTVTGETCAEVVSSLAFVAAMALDPAAAGRTPGIAAPPASDASAAAMATEAADASPSLEAGSAGDGGGPTRAPPATQEPPGARPAAEEQRRSWTLSAGVDVRLVAGAAPPLVVAIPIFLELSATGESVFTPALRVSFMRAAGSTHSTGGGADFTWTTGGLDLCPIAWSPRDVRAEACLTTVIGVLAAAGTGVDPPRSSSRPWISMGAGGRTRWYALDPAFFEIGASVDAPLVRDVFFVRPDTTVFRVPVVGWAVAAGAGATFW